jgi:DNA-binding NtrC family response regulator
MMPYGELLDNHQEPTMNDVPLIIFESTGDWAAELARRLPPGVSLVETRSLEEMWEQLHSNPAAVIALEFTLQRAERLLAALVRIDREFPQAIVIALAECKLAGWEEIVRESGAVHFIASPRKMDEVVELVRRRSVFAADDCLAPSDEPVSLEVQMLASLPWGD